MGLFDSLFGKKKPTNVEVVPDKIWLTTDAKFAGLTKELAHCSKSETTAILLVAHFPNVLTRLAEISEEQSSDVPTTAVLARDLNADLAKRLGSATSQMPPCETDDRFL